MSTTLIPDATTPADGSLMRVCQSATLAGTVLNALTQLPIQGATVFWGPELFQSTQTDAQGKYVLLDIPAGFRNGPNQISLTASAPNFNPQFRTITIFCGASISVDFGRQATAFSTIAGRATDTSTGLPIVGAFVFSEFGASTTSTDASGFYQLSNMPLGTNDAPRDWRITVAPTDFPQQTRMATVRANQTTTLDYAFGGTTARKLTFTADGLPASASWVPTVNGFPPIFSAPLTHTVDQAAGGVVTLWLQWRSPLAHITSAAWGRDDEDADFGPADQDAPRVELRTYQITDAAGACLTEVVAHNGDVLDLGRFARADPATGGFDTTVWHLERGGRHYALRVFRPNQMATLQRELVALRAARGGGVPVPRVHAIGTFQERPALLMQWSNGRPLLDALRARPGQLLTLGVRFGRQHAAIHRVAAPASLRANWIAWAGPLEPRLEALLERLARVQKPRLLHLDYHPLNVLTHDGQVSAVLDWTNAHAGDPRADFARTVTILRLSPPMGGLAERAMRMLLELGWRHGYGATHTRQDMAPFYAWAGAAMQHDLGGRFSAAGLAHVRRWTNQWR